MPKVKSQAPKKASAKAKKAVKAPTPTPEVVDTPPVVNTPVETPVENTPVDVNATGNNVKAAPNLLDYSVEMAAMEEQLKAAMNAVKVALTNLSTLQKKVAREKKVVDRKMNGKVKKVKDPNAPPTGFDKPVTISKELATFLGTSPDEKVSRSSVTSRVSTYCKESGLQKKTDGRKIIPDKKLSALLHIKEGVETNFFELQKHLANHYPETVAKKAAAAAKASA